MALVANTAEAYRDIMIAMLPPGTAWTSSPDSNLGKLLLAMGGELSRVEQRAIDLVKEMDPRSVTELLTDWELDYALPDTCSSQAKTVELRRETLVAKATDNGDQSRAFYIELAASLGFPGALITEFEPHTVESSVEDPIFGEDWKYAWQLTAARGEIRQITVESTVEESLGELSPTTRLECIINQLKPAHSVALFNYT